MTEDATDRARAQGAVEARLDGLERRMDRHETWIAAELKGLGSKLDEAAKSMGEVLRMVIELKATQGSGHRWTTALLMLGGALLSGAALRFLGR